jgi:predicted membrane protein
MEKHGELFIADKLLIAYFKVLEKKSLYGLLLGLFIFILFTFFFYVRAGISIQLVIDVLVCSTVCGVMIYGSTFKQSNILTNTIKKISIEDDKLVIETFSYDIAKIFKKEGTFLELRKDQVTLSECDYPLVDKKHIKEKAIKIHGSNIEFYILKEYFKNDLSVRLFEL